MTISFELSSRMKTHLEHHLPGTPVDTEGEHFLFNNRKKNFFQALDGSSSEHHLFLSYSIKNPKSEDEKNPICLVKTKISNKGLFHYIK